MMKILKNFFSNKKKIQKYKKEISVVKKENEELKKQIREPNYADLMRENLGSLIVDFANKNPDYLEGVNPERRKQMIFMANELYKNEMFEIIINHLINKQGNYILKEATSDAQIFAGRFNINGLMLIKKEVERCHGLFEDITKTEDFDKFEII